MTAELVMLAGVLLRFALPGEADSGERGDSIAVWGREEPPADSADVAPRGEAWGDRSAGAGVSWSERGFAGAAMPVCGGVRGGGKGEQ